ncbi:1-acyl-sn-glycerol-3-phosphate acyltransferase [Elizabethkingia sp. JS20170427COW]|uniref:1-acyl-sn-glycerol-3-phosphate acyltransferase n=1 Tax=Elizabethkingia sp. JS20170427COW TaxID=2583851 RepID=UPI0011102F80|nr:1-acyl-sn-glycerol-3-phosphate acyltransferase [Elizabethkingia sp. JS20170427COW]QCX54065.1 1-acyl-sn-glycerol-3-phosphate acyltransferase [Elizabethkingia sp. JS20170427COW]
MTKKYDSIRFFHPEEVNPSLRYILRHPLMKVLLHYSFPHQSQQEVVKIVENISSIEDFQSKIIYPCMQNILKNTSKGLSFSGIENVPRDQACIYISNHRDIVLDTGVLNLVLLENQYQLTASVIGDNLVQRELYLILAKLNRNFFVKRNALPRELLENSKLLSEYIYKLNTEDQRSVWIAQREGRAKDGNDFTQAGVLKMITMHDPENKPMEYLKKLKVVPVSISYEYDPTDSLKVKKALSKNQEKHKNEDFISILTGVVGQKQRIHLHFGEVKEEKYYQIQDSGLNANKQVQAFSEVLTQEIIQGYHLWPSNYIAADLLLKQHQYADFYTEREKAVFLKRMKMRLHKFPTEAQQIFLEAYANPVLNQEKYQE